MDSRGLPIRPGKWITVAELRALPPALLERFRILLMPCGIITGFCTYREPNGHPTFDYQFPVHKTMSTKSVWLVSPQNETIFWFSCDRAMVMGDHLHVQLTVSDGKTGVCDSGYRADRPVVQRELGRGIGWRRRKNSVSPGT